MGIERTIEIMEAQNLLKPPKALKKLTITHVGEEASQYAMRLAESFREKSIVTIVAPRNRSLKSQLRFANSILSSHVVIIGESEIHNKTLMLRDLNTKEQQELDITSAITQMSK